METRINPHRIFGRFFNMLPNRGLPRCANSANNSSIGKVSLTMGNEIMGEWLWIKENLR
ncbi:MAG: hypothetical protein LLG06_08875 [Desulfobacteraceae bacterium]|nr:hypothetical protein [Desulfobacteraceae bacterium]